MKPIFEKNIFKGFILVALSLMVFYCKYICCRDSVTVSISSIGWRQESLNKVIQAFLPQVDKINVFLQWYDSIPPFLNHEKITVAEGKDYPEALALGSCAKFFWAKNVRGYHFIADDDIIYPNDYVAYCINKIEQYDRKAVIGFHGSFIQENKNKFFRRIIPYYQALEPDTWVNMLGTGVLAYHSDTMIVSIDDFFIRNHDDIVFAINAREHGIPLLCVQRKSDYIIPIKDVANDERALFHAPDAKKIDAQIMKEYSPWPILKPQ